ncbi:MAG: PilN domain-containing protein [Syntrophaceae bacterium]|nr:PilN domain-containing protein [Syntrophaceae bacterium]
MMNLKQVLKDRLTFASRVPVIVKGATSRLRKILFTSLADDRIAPANCLCVHLTKGMISLAYGTRFLSRITIRATRSYPQEEADYPAPEDLASIVHLAAIELKAEKTSITLIVPKALSIIRIASLPLVVKENMDKVISYELDRLTPLKPEQAHYDYQILGEDEKQLRIGLEAMKTSTIDPYLQALRQKGLNVERVIVSLKALGALGRHVSKKNDFIFLDGTADWYEGGVIRDGHLDAAFAGNISTREHAAESHPLASEVDARFRVFASEPFEEKPLLITVRESFPMRLLSGIHAPVKHLREMDLKLRFLQRPAEMPYTVLGGILESLSPGASGTNLLSKGIHKSQQTPIFLTSLLMATILATGLFLFVLPLFLETKKIEILDHEIAIRKDEINRIMALKKESAGLENEIRTIEQFKTARPMALTLLRELTLNLPSKAWLSRVRISENAIQIEGYAQSATDILKRLEAAPLFNKVEFSSSTYRDARMNADRFAIKMEIEGVSDKKVTE